MIKKFGKTISKNLLDDLASRFIINLPVEERLDTIRLFFNIEDAHWFYLDYYCEHGSRNKKCNLTKFAIQLLNHIPSLAHTVRNIDENMKKFIKYKSLIPTYGAIIISEREVLMVQSTKFKSWGFPKGKINQYEKPVDCAIREVKEETGLDITLLINPDLFVESFRYKRYVRLYIVQNVSTEVCCQPNTRGEIAACQWFNLDSLLEYQKNNNSPFVMTQCAILTASLLNCKLIEINELSDINMTNPAEEVKIIPVDLNTEIYKVIEPRQQIYEHGDINMTKPTEEVIIIPVALQAEIQNKIEPRQQIYDHRDNNFIKNQFRVDLICVGLSIFLTYSVCCLFRFIKDQKIMEIK